MAVNESHIIQRQSFDLEVPTQQEGLRLHQLLQQASHHSLLPVISRMLDDLAGDETVLVIDQLKIDIGTLPVNATAEEWIERIKDCFQQSIRGMQHNKTNGLQQETIRENRELYAIRNWMYFLETGRLMPDSIFNDLKSLQQVIWNLDITAQKLLQSALYHLKHGSISMQRLAALPVPQLFHLLQMLAPAVGEQQGWTSFLYKVNLLVQDAGSVAGKTTSRVLNALIEKKEVLILESILITVNKGLPVVPSELIKTMEMILAKMITGERGSKVAILQQEDKHIPIQTNPQQTTTQHQINAEGQPVFVVNAGLCLLVPFLPRFFNNLQLVKATGFISREQQQHAIYLLHFLVTGESSATEEKLVLPKLLCGWPLLMPCILEEEISVKEKEESIELLQSVIGHWQVLKNTSPDGLREGFLQRDGRLMMEDDRHVLMVEQKTQDILLESIPWSFRMSSLPWMKKRMEVEWC